MKTFTEKEIRDFAELKIKDLKCMFFDEYLKKKENADFIAYLDRISGLEFFVDKLLEGDDSVE